MAGLLQRLRAWWNRDALTKAEEETRMTPAERDVLEEDFEARKDDLLTSGSPEGLLGGADYEADSERPADPAP
jgi:hypothetical protein